MSDVVLINITGRDRKGLDARFTAILAEYKVNILKVAEYYWCILRHLKTLVPGIFFLISV